MNHASSYLPNGQQHTKNRELLVPWSTAPINFLGQSPAPNIAISKENNIEYLLPKIIQSYSKVCAETTRLSSLLGKTKDNIAGEARKMDSFLSIPW